jgi:transcriptional regulator with XRE-family HTH domain
MECLGHRVRYARACRGVSRRLAAELLRVNALTLADYERGKRSTPYPLVRLMAWAYDVPIAWLVDGEGEVPCKPPTAAQRLCRGVLSTDPELLFRARMGRRPWEKDLPRVGG